MTVAGNNLSKIPESWIMTSLESISEPLSGFAFKSKEYSDSGLQIVKIGNIKMGKLSLSDKPTFINGINSNIENRYLLKANDVLITLTGTKKKRDYGFVAIVKNESNLLLNQRVARLRFRSPLSSDFFFLALQQESFRDQFFKYETGIVGQGNVGIEAIKKTLVPMPPLHEQHRIVDRIEELFSRLDAGMEALRRAKAQLQHYRQSVLMAAMEGRLTEDWRKAHPDVEPAENMLQKILREGQAKYEQKYHQSHDIRHPQKLPNSWIWTKSNTIFSFVTSGSRGWAKYYSDEGPIFIRIGNLDHDSISLDLTNIQRVKPPLGAEGTRTRVMPNDILISITADVGMIALVPKDIEEAYINQHVSLIRPVSKINPSYIAWYLSSEEGGQRQFLKLQRGATKVGLGLDDIRSVSIPLPPFVEQGQIVSEIERCFSLVDNVESTIASNVKRGDRIRQSILKHAFEGKLVPQDLGDEPASVLLERIKARRPRMGSSNQKRSRPMALNEFSG